MKSIKAPQILKNSYVRFLILMAILFVGIFAFWFGLRLAFQTDFPLLAVASGSMEPVLYKGDLIIVQGGLNFAELNAAPKSAQHPGEVIVYYDPRFGKDSNHLIVHRAIEKYQHENGTWFFYTAGDASGGSEPDPWTKPHGLRQDFIVGKVIGKVPWVGHIPLIMRTPSGILLIVFLFAVLIIVDFIFPQREGKKTRG